MATIPMPPRSAVVDVYANNDLDFKAKKFIVNPRTSSNMEQVIDALSQTLSIVGGVRRLYNVHSGDRVRDVEELYDTKSVVATGKERLNRRLLKAIHRKQAAANGSDPVARDIRDAYLVKARKKDSKSFPGAMQVRRRRKYARAKGPRFHGTRDLDRRGHLRQRFEGNPHQVLPPVSAPTEGRQLSSLTEGNATTSSADDAHTKPRSAPSSNKPMDTGSKDAHTSVAAADVVGTSLASPIQIKGEQQSPPNVSEKSSTAPPPGQSPATTANGNRATAIAGPQAPTPGVLSNRVDYLLAQVSQVERRAALERRRQQASIKRKMTQKLHGGDALLHAYENEQQQRERVLDSERERQQAILREKLRNKPTALVRERIPDSLKEDVEASDGVAENTQQRQAKQQDKARGRPVQSKAKKTTVEVPTTHSGFARASGPGASENPATGASTTGTSTSTSTGYSATGATQQVRNSNNHRTERPLRARPVNTEAAAAAAASNAQQQKDTAAAKDAASGKAGAGHEAGQRGGVRSRLPQKQIGYAQRHTRGYQQRHQRKKQLRKQQQQQQQQSPGEKDAIPALRADDEPGNGNGNSSGNSDSVSASEDNGAVSRVKDEAMGSLAASPTKATANTAAAAAAAAAGGEGGGDVEREANTERHERQRKNKGAARNKHQPATEDARKKKVKGDRKAVDAGTQQQGHGTRPEAGSASAVNDGKRDTKKDGQHQQQQERQQQDQEQQQQQQQQIQQQPKQQHEIEKKEQKQKRKKKTTKGGKAGEAEAPGVATEEVKEERLPTPVPTTSLGRGRQHGRRMSGDAAAEAGKQGARPPRLSPVADAEEASEGDDPVQQAAVKGKIPQQDGEGEQEEKEEKGKEREQEKWKEKGKEKEVPKEEGKKKEKKEEENRHLEKSEGGGSGEGDGKAERHDAPADGENNSAKYGASGPTHAPTEQQQKQQKGEKEREKKPQEDEDSQDGQRLHSTHRVRVATPDLAVSSSMMDLYRTDAAVKIQAAFRGYRARKALAWKPASQRRKEAEAREKKKVKEKIMKKQRKQRGKQPLVASDHGLVDQAYVDERFEVYEKLGDGNFADVYRCKARDSGNEYALKIVYKSRLVGKRERAMIANEVSIMRSIDHRHIIRLCDVLETSDRIFLVLELVHGGDLFDRIVERGRFTESDAKRLVRHLAEAVAYLHQRSIVHRDLKPENILVAQDEFGRDVLKLADFGLSMHVEEKIYTICGTPTYVAPEIISQDAVGYGLQVDTWAIGVIMYIMLCGFPPFSSSNKSQRELFDRIRRGAFTFPEPYWKDVTPEAKALIKNLLRVDPKSRLTPQQVLRHAWLKERPSTAAVCEQDRHVPVVEELLKHFPQKKRWSDAVTKIRSTNASQQQSRVTSAA